MTLSKMASSRSNTRTTTIITFYHFPFLLNDVLSGFLGFQHKTHVAADTQFGNFLDKYSQHKDNRTYTLTCNNLNGKEVIYIIIIVWDIDKG